MQQYRLIATYGFAIFTMFFGSGNLVFPLSIGYYSVNNWLLGFLGLLLTGVVLPFLGLFVIKLHKGNYKNFFNEAGSVAGNIIPFFTLSLLGSFGVVPRCITVAHGGMNHIFPELSLWVFASLFCIASFFLCLKDQIMVKILGKWMSPILLIILVALIGFGIAKSPPLNIVTTENKAFIHGFLIGYQTMDLFAAFFFSALIFKQIQNSMPANTSDRTILIFAVNSSIIGSGLLMIIYLGFVFLGAHYSTLLVNVSPENMLPTIINHVMGGYATVVLAVAIVLSCLTTAVSLNNIYARYISSLLALNDNKFSKVLLFTTLVSFVISLLDFRVIANFLAPALEVSYPALIALTIMSICTRKYQKLKIYMFWFMILGASVYGASEFN